MAGDSFDYGQTEGGSQGGLTSYDFEGARWEGLWSPDECGDALLEHAPAETRD